MQTGMAPPLTFISPAIIERIERGAFVPSRHAKPNTSGQAERRDVLSPLAVTKRCIRYEPNVFDHRKPYILQMARALNEPKNKILLLGGPQGCGKTSLARGLLELMGSRNEQLLWFDVNRHTDFDEIIQFLIQYITYVCATFQEANANSGASDQAAPDEEPLKRLEKLLNRVSTMPLLLVLDNVEYIVDPDLRFNSYPFKEMLNFLLAFPNIKMVLIGERLPVADMSPNQEGVADLRLPGLPEQEAIRFLQSLKKQSSETPDTATLERIAAPESEAIALGQLYHKTEGQPWLLKILYHLNHQARLDFSTLNRLLESDSLAGTGLPVAELAALIYQRLPEQHRRLFQVLAIIRHPVDTQALLAMEKTCFPILGASTLEQAALQDMLEHSPLKVLLKINYPPQEVLSHIRKRRQERKNSGDTSEKDRKFKPWYELYHAIKLILYTSLPIEERERLHSLLQGFYLQEKGQEPGQRILKIKNRAIIAEAKYHGSAARDRKPATGTLFQKSPEAPIASKTYLSSFGKALANPAPNHLQDYPTVNLGGQTPFSQEKFPRLETTEQPAFMSLLQRPAVKSVSKDQLEGLDLTPEEQQLLSRQESLGDMLSRGQTQPPQETSKAPEPPPEEQETRPKGQKASIDVLSESQLAQAHDEQEKSLQNRLALAVASQDRPAIVRELLELARYRASHGRYESAEHCLEKALSLKNNANKEVIAEIYRLSGSVHKETFHHNAALASLTKAAEQIRKLMYEDDTVGAVWLGRMGKVYQDLGEIYAYRKQPEAAIDALQQALRWYNSSDDSTRQAEVYFQMAGVFDDARQPEEAIEHYLKALALDEAQQNEASAAASLANLAAIYQESGHPAEAIDCLQRSLNYDRNLKNLEGQWTTLNALTGLYLQQENWPLAETTARQGLGLATHESTHLWQATFYTKLGQLHEAQSDWRQAFKQYQLARSTGAQVLADDSLRWLDGKIATAQKQF